MAILRLTLVNKPSEIPRVMSSLGEFLDEEGVVPAMAHRTKLVVEELIANVVQHAFDDDATHTILLDVRTEPAGVVIVVEDDGKPFDPRAVSPPSVEQLLKAGADGGLGITIIQKVTSDLEYTREAGKNRVRAFIAHARHR